MDTAPLPDNRIESRSNLFVMATLYAAGGSTPVRIRNMSPGGGLIEASAFPPLGTLVRLSRGSFSIAGAIVWVDESRAGVRFASPIAVADWLPQGRRGAGQQLIDEVVHRSRVGAMPKPEANSALLQENAPLSEELMRLRQTLERAGEALASDPVVTSHHMAALQMIDAVAQALARLAGEGSAA